VTATPIASPSASGATGAAFSDPAQLLAGLGVVLAFGLLAILVVVIFILEAQGRYFQAVERLARRGIVTSPGQTEATIKAGARTQLNAAGQPADITVAGPKYLTVGEPAEYTAKAEGKLTRVTWSTQGADKKPKLEPTTASERVKVTPTESGPFAILATVQAGAAYLAVTAEKPSTAATVLGYVGAGWGSIVVSIVVAAVVAALGIAGVLDGQAIAGIYGALVGYLFGFQLRSAGTGGEGTGTTGGSGSGSA
jgi:hypothetical protein